MKNKKYKCLYIIIVFTIAFTHNLLSQNKHVISVYSDVNGLENFFVPLNINVNLGDTIIWLPGNKPIINHSITTKRFPLSAETINFTFKLPADTICKYVVRVEGVYVYECMPHSPYMFGRITVSTPNGIIPENVKYMEKNYGPQLAPNPARNIVAFYQLDESVKYTLKIYNELGKLVTETSMANVKEYEINIANFDSGIYTAHLAYCGCKPAKNGCGAAGETLKFVKQ